MVSFDGFSESFIGQPIDDKNFILQLILNIVFVSFSQLRSIFPLRCQSLFDSLFRPIFVLFDLFDMNFVCLDVKIMLVLSSSHSYSGLLSLKRPNSSWANL